MLMLHKAARVHWVVLASDDDELKVMTRCGVCDT